jgi:hypothetical protein
VHAALLSEDGAGLHLDAILDNGRGVARNGNGSPFNTSPSTHSAVPSNDRVQHARIVLDLSILENDRLLYTRARADGGARANGDVWPQLGSWVDLRARVDVDRRDDVRRRLGELVGAVLPRLLQIQGVGRDGRASRLDLTPEVLSLVHVELLVIGHVAQDVLLETDHLALAVLVVVIVCGNEGVFEVVGRGVRHEAGRAIGSAFDRAANGGKDRLGAEEVHAAVDHGRYVGFGLLDIVQHTACVGVRHDAAEVRGCLLADPRTQDHRLGVLLAEHLEHLVEREAAAHVGVQNEDVLRLALEDGIAEVVQAARGAQRLVFSEVLDRQVRKLGRRILDEVAENGLVVVAD